MQTFHALATVAASAAASSPLDPAGLLHGLGPAALAVIAGMVFIESGVLFPFLPGDSLLFTAGLLLHQQLNVSLPVLIGVVAAASVAGDQVGYTLGRKFGCRWFKDDARIFKSSHLAQTEEFFRRHGGSAVVLAWSVSVILLGSWLGHFDIIANNIDLIAVTMVLVSVIPWGIEFLKRRRNRGSADGERAGEDPVKELATEE
ncbi:DedA family protein [Pseudarthrobacter sp. AB1]|uniref:DedA family protein n=1 Tax=Pseudarthrobacter sp. AB1 TaxID=2138309 RepID=UPI00186B7C37|nr:alkaline phosphatase [Pseudarthrobacter sp. AB1]MBE4718402.1 alkaline phosphatase [Pseudarthrobacter sp. AB1]